MKRKWMLLMLTSAAVQAAPTPTTVLSCWDGTFAYNTFRIEKSSTHVFVTLSGSRLADEKTPFSLYNLHERFSVGRTFDRTATTVALKRSQCRLDEINKTLACEGGDLMDQNWVEAIYVTRMRDDLGKALQLVSRFPVQKIELQASTEGLSLKKSQRFAGTGEVVSEELKIGKYEVGGGEILDLNCSQGGMQFSSKVPQKLVDFL